MLLYLINGMEISKFLNVEEGKEKKKKMGIQIMSSLRFLVSYLPREKV
ncbi:hypothetical protein V6Z12_D13G102500 [Gossypium hirsutum]